QPEPIIRSAYRNGHQYLMLFLNAILETPQAKIEAVHNTHDTVGFGAGDRFLVIYKAVAEILCEELC
ncbi:MAG: hypothetical protein AAB456_02430, partial [Patescibacteria group bacterium]